MNLEFDKNLIAGYKSQVQITRVVTEHWVENSAFCPNCGKMKIDKYPNNWPVADFYCSNCKEDFELKSQKGIIGKRIVDGSYRTMIERMQGINNPNFFLLNYDLKKFEVLNFFVIPKHYFVPAMIEKRNPLRTTARRAGWIGCNILLRDIPQSGKIYFVKDQIVEPKDKVLSEWKRTLFLRKEKELDAKGWLLDIMTCVEKLSCKEFLLKDMYYFEKDLRKKYPGNYHIRDKIRQQLQVLRDKGYLEFIGQGRYCIKG